MPKVFFQCFLLRFKGILCMTKLGSKPALPVHLWILSLLLFLLLLLLKCLWILLLFFLLILLVHWIVGLNLIEYTLCYWLKQMNLPFYEIFLKNIIRLCALFMQCLDIAIEFFKLTLRNLCLMGIFFAVLLRNIVFLVLLRWVHKVGPWYQRNGFTLVIWSILDVILLLMWRSILIYFIEGVKKNLLHN